MHHASRLQRLAAVALALLVTPLLVAQPENPVYVDDSPRAWELFRQARDQQQDNAAEAVRLYQELLDDYGSKLVPRRDDGASHFTAIRERVHQALAADDALLERYRLLQGAEGRRLLAAGELRRLALTRSLTEAGLDALMLLAQDALESGRFHTARRWLHEAGQHPDLIGRAAVHCGHMRGLVAHYLGDVATVEEAITLLQSQRTRDARQCAEHLLKVRADASVRRPAPTVTSMDYAAVVELDDIVDRPIWQQSFLRSGPMDVNHGAIENPFEEPLPAQLISPVPAVTETMIYLHDGRFVRAIDRFTGRTVWPRPADQAQRYGTQASDRRMELNAVAVADDRVIAFAGKYRVGRPGRGGRVICLDAADGSELWDVSIDGIGGFDDHVDLVPFGTPVIGEQKVYVLARKATKQLLTSCYVIALDLETGRLDWSRHVASVASTRSQDVRYLPYSRLVLHDGDLHLASSVGAVARIEGSTGTTQWLRRYSAPLSFSSRTRPGWDLQGPVMTARGMLSMQTGQNRIVLHDPETGEELETHDAGRRDTWNTPRYLLADEQMVYAIGLRDIRAFDINNLEVPIWQVPGDNPAARAMSGIGQSTFDFAGRVQLVNGALVVPLHNAVLLIDPMSGVQMQSLDVEESGNPVLIGAQLFVASPTSIRSYMPFSRAEEILRSRLASQPDDARPALSLLQMASSAQDVRLALEAAELATSAINARPIDDASRSHQDELFETLILLDAQRIAASRVEGEALHAMLGAVAATSEQQVRHLLSYARWLGEDRSRLSDAVQALQQIMTTEPLAEADVEVRLCYRPARAIATQHLAALIDRYGPQIYAAEQDFARARLGPEGDRVAMGPDGDLQRVARHYPFSDAAIEAARRLLINSGNDAELSFGIGVLLELYRAWPTEDRARHLLGLYASAASDRSWTQRAGNVARFVQGKYGDIQLGTPSGPRRASTWNGTAPLAPAVIGELREGGLRLPGALVHPLPQAGEIPRDRVLLRDGTVVRMFMASEIATKKEVWSRDLGLSGPRILRFDRDMLVLWVPAPDPRAIWLNPDTGDELWISPNFAHLIDDGLGLHPLRASGGGDMPSGAPFIPDEVIPVADERYVVLARRAGDIAVFEPQAGRRELWSQGEVLSRIHHVELHEHALMLAGQAWSVDPVTGGRTLVPQLVLLDPADGEELARVRLLGKEGVIWGVTTPLGEYVYATPDGVRKVDLFTGRESWTNLAAAARRTRRGLLLGDALIVEDSAGLLHSVALEDGSMSQEFDVPLDSDWTRLDPLNLIARDDRLIIRYKERVVAFDADGQLMGRDVVTGSRDYKLVVPAADRLLLVNRWKSEQAPRNDRGRRRTEHTYHIYMLSPNCKLLGEVLELPPIPQRVSNGLAVDGWLLLSFDDATQPETAALPALPGS